MHPRESLPRLAQNSPGPIVCRQPKHVAAPLTSQATWAHAAHLLSSITNSSGWSLQPSQSNNGSAASGGERVRACAHAWCLVCPADDPFPA